MLGELRERVAALEEQGDLNRTEIERLQSAQDFTTRLLTDRSSSIEHPG